MVARRIGLKDQKSTKKSLPRKPLSFQLPETGGKLTHTPSFEDFSLGTAADAEEELSPKAASVGAAAPAGKKGSDPAPPPSSSLARASAPGDLSHSPPSTPSPTAAAASNKLSSSSASDLVTSEVVTKQPAGASIWSSVFHPRHRQASGEPPMPLGTRYYDTASSGDKTTWEEVVKSERLQTLARLPRTKGEGAGGGGGFIDAGQLRTALGASEDVEQLIAAARDGRKEEDGRVPFDTFATLLRNS